MTILYRVHNNLYVNLTNRCPCACTFCLRKTRDHMEDSGSLWLSQEPTAEEVIREFEKWNVDEFDEVVFCGFGEPTEALEVLLEVAGFVKKTYGKPIRINTNGLGNLVNGKKIAPLMKGLVDTVSISLNTPDSQKYLELVRPKYGEGSFKEMLQFARECVDVIPNVVFTTVATTLTAEEEEKCAGICKEVGAQYRIRPWED